jgi:hypothetical protein
MAMNLSDARRLARHTSDDTNSVTYVYQNTLNSKTEDYDVAFSIPEFGMQEGEPFHPLKKKKVKDESRDLQTQVPEGTLASTGHGRGMPGTLHSHQRDTGNSDS